MAKCPHSCGHCRAIEHGLGGRPLSPAEYLLVNGPPIELDNHDRVVWSAETAEAALAMELADAHFEACFRAYEDACRKSWESPAASNGRRSQFLEAVEALQEDVEEASEQLGAARARYYRLANRDSQAHAEAIYQAGQVVQAQARADARKARKAGAKKLFGLVGGQ